MVIGMGLPCKLLLVWSWAPRTLKLRTTQSIGVRLAMQRRPGNGARQDPLAPRKGRSGCLPMRVGGGSGLCLRPPQRMRWAEWIHRLRKAANPPIRRPGKRRQPSPVWLQFPFGWGYSVCRRADLLLLCCWMNRIFLFGGEVPSHRVPSQRKLAGSWTPITHSSWMWSLRQKTRIFVCFWVFVPEMFCAFFFSPAKSFFAFSCVYFLWFFDFK